MIELQSDSSFGENLCGIPNLRRFRHGAMAATFDVFIAHPDAKYAEQAAWAAFDELDRIEANLSRFIENSDVSRINSLEPGRPLQLSPATFECLQIAIEMYKQTNGAFDITFGSLHKSGAGSRGLVLNEADHTVELLTNGIRIDLGAVGKGYAADKMSRLLRDWSIDDALISAGQSAILPIGIPPRLLVEDNSVGWPLTLSDPLDHRKLLAKIHLAGCALSASGLRKGPHIIDTRSGKSVEAKLAAWATAETAAAADALSTAFMVAPVDEVRSFCQAHIGTAALLIMPGEDKTHARRILRFGSWEKAVFYYQ